MKKILPLVVVAVLSLCVAIPALAGGHGNGMAFSHSSGSIGPGGGDNVRQEATDSAGNKISENQAFTKAVQHGNNMTKTRDDGQESVVDTVYRGIQRALENVENPVARAALQAKLEGASVSQAVYEAVFEAVYETNDVVNVDVNGKPLHFAVAPTIVGGTTMVPMRTVFEALGAGVQWDGNTGTVTGKKGDRTVVLKVNSDDAVVNGVHEVLDLPATIVDGTTFVPVRFISEALGAGVNWDAGSQTVDINTV